MIRDDETCENIKSAYQTAIKKSDFDTILTEYEIKMKKNNRVVSALRVTLPIKKAIIRMAFYEPEDIFDYDRYIQTFSNSNSNSNA